MRSDAVVAINRFNGCESIFFNIFDDIEKARSREGLVPVRKTVTRQNKTFQQIFWVTPKDLRAMHAENAANLLEGMVKAQQHFKSMLDSAEKYLPDAAAAVRDKITAAGGKMKTIAGLELALAEHSRQDPVSGDALLAAIHSRSEAVIPQHIKNVVNNLYKNITTTTYGESLRLGGATVATIKTSTAQRMHDWSPTKWRDKLKEIVGKKVEEIKGKLGLRRATEAARKEALTAKPVPKERKLKAPIAAEKKIAPTSPLAEKLGLTEKRGAEFKVTPGVSGKQPTLSIKQPLSMKRYEPLEPKPRAAELTLASVKSRMKKEGFHEGIRRDYIKTTGAILPKNRVEALHEVEAALGLKKKKRVKKFKGA